MSAVKWSAVALVLFGLILIPFMVWGDAVDAWVESRSWAPSDPLVPSLTIAALLTLDGLLPVPSSLLSTLLGALLGAVAGTAVGTIAMTAGVLTSYWLGRLGGKPLARKLLGEQEIQRVSDWLAEHGILALAICRPIPVLAEASIVVAGSAGMRVMPVLATTFLANLGISAIYASVGATAEGAAAFLMAFTAALVLPGLFYLRTRGLMSRR